MWSFFRQCNQREETVDIRRTDSALHHSLPNRQMRYLPHTRMAATPAVSYEPVHESVKIPYLFLTLPRIVLN